MEAIQHTDAGSYKYPAGKFYTIIHAVNYRAASMAWGSAEYLDDLKMLSEIKLRAGAYKTQSLFLGYVRSGEKKRRTAKLLAGLAIMLVLLVAPTDAMIRRASDAIGASAIRAQTPSGTQDAMRIRWKLPVLAPNIEFAGVNATSAQAIWIETGADSMQHSDAARADLLSNNGEPGQAVTDLQYRDTDSGDTASDIAEETYTETELYILASIREYIDMLEAQAPLGEDPADASQAVTPEAEPYGTVAEENSGPEDFITGQVSDNTAGAAGLIGGAAPAQGAGVDELADENAGQLDEPAARNYVWPAAGIVTSDYGRRSTTIGSRNHQGIDIGGNPGQAIYAADSGEVIFSGWSNSYGYMIRIRHENGDETVYGHCQSLKIKTGAIVAQGDTIAAMGMTGIASGVHLHFELIIDGKNVDPEQYLPRD